MADQISAPVQTELVADWLRARVADGVAPHEIGAFVRTVETLPRAAGVPHSAITADADRPPGGAARATMHIAKGMEFRAIAVMACDQDLLPLAARIETVADESDLGEVYATERHLLYVACTRARVRKSAVSGPLPRLNYQLLATPIGHVPIRGV